MNASNDALVEAAIDETADFESVFHAQYRHITGAIVSIIQDPGRAEEIAVEVFLKWSRHSAAHGSGAKAWLYRTASRMALDELRRQARRQRYERLLHPNRTSPTPEMALATKQEQAQVRAVLAAISRRQAQLLFLRSQGLDYNELAVALDVNAASIGTLLARAQQAFRKEYVKRYGNQ